MRRSASGQASAFSAQQHGFESHTSHQFLPVAQLDERPATNREACRFDPCREGQFNRV